MRRLVLLVLLGLPVAGAAPAATTAPPLRLEAGSIESVSWSHDGRWLAVVRFVRSSRSYELRLIRGDGARQEVVLAGRSNYLVLTWARKSNAYQLYEFKLNGELFTGMPGRRPRRLGIGYGSLDPAGRRLAFVSSGSLYVADRSGARRTRLTDAAGPVEWSPDGKEIVFGRRVDRGSCGTKSRLFLIRPNGTGHRPLTPDTRPYNGDELVRGDQRFPKWSPDGRRLIVHEWYPCGWSSFPEDDHHVFVVQPRSALAPLWLGSGTATWSPSGRRIALHTAWSTPTGLSIVSPDGRVRTSTVTSHEVDGHPDLSWSPDGSRIVFAGHQNEKRLHVMRADGTGVRGLAKGELAAWSPRGDRIVFRRSVGCGDVLLWIAPNGKRVRALTRC